MLQTNSVMVCDVFYYLYQETEIIRVKSDVDSVVWLVSEEPLKDSSFLSPEILRFCGDLPVYWQHPANPRGISHSINLKSHQPLTLSLHHVRKKKRPDLTVESKTTESLATKQH